MKKEGIQTRNRKLSSKSKKKKASLGGHHQLQQFHDIIKPLDKNNSTTAFSSYPTNINNGGVGLGGSSMSPYMWVKQKYLHLVRILSFAEEEKIVGE